MNIEYAILQIQHHRKKILLFWFLLMIGSLIFFSSGFLEKTVNEFAPPAGSDAAMAINMQEEYFPETINQGSHIITIHHQSNVINEHLAFVTQQIATWSIKEYQEYVQNIQGYFILANTSLDYLKDEFVSDDQTTTFLSITVSAEDEIQSDFLSDLRDHISSLEAGDLEIYVTGFQALSDDTNHAIENDLGRIDAITIPLVFILLVVLLRNWRYFPVTMTTIAMALSITFAIMDRYITLFNATILSFVPSVLISLTLGIGVDYNLFLLSRFKEEKSKGHSNIEAVMTMMKRAGHTVFTSGLTLVISMAGLIFFPIPMINSLGIAVAIGISVLLLINLTLTPAILLIFGDWFEKPIAKSQMKENLDTSTSNGNSDSNQVGFWYRIARIATKYSKTVLIITLILTLPLAFQLINTNPETETQFFAPRNSEASDGFLLLEEKFEPGLISPLGIIVVPDNGDVWSLQSFDLLHGFIEKTIEDTKISSSDIQSHVWLGNQKIEYEIALMLTQSSSALYNTSDATIYRSFAFNYVSTTTNVESQAAYIQLTLPIDPNSKQARDLLSDLTEIANLILGDDATFGFTGQTTINDASIQSSYELFPVMILVVILAIYILVGLMFRSILLPARLILTIGLTISFIYGMATVVFQSSTILNDFIPLINDVSVVFWMVPIMSFSIILGLGMDYDIFTIERIKENIWNGMSNDEAIAQGLNKTGRIITGAGLIMMLAFGGMMFSSSYILIQFGFVLTFAVFLDTFIVRSLLVPSIMSISDKYNWWPNNPPIQDSLEDKAVDLSIMSGD